MEDVKRVMATNGSEFAKGFGERLREIKDRSGLDIVTFAEKLGVSKAAISNYLHGRRIPDAFFVYKVCRNFQINPDWLLFGEGAPERKKKKTELEVYEFIPLLSEIAFFENSDFRIDTSLVKSWYPFRRDWLKKILGIENLEPRVRDLFLYPVKDDGMIPTLNPRDLVLIDGNPEIRREPEPGRIYLVRLEWKIYVFRKLVMIRKCLEKNNNEVILVYIGDKPDQPPKKLTIPQDEILHYVIGEALWGGREIRKSTWPE